MTEREWITCYLCGRPARVNLNGQLRKHKARLSTMYRIGRWCENRSPFGTSNGNDHDR